MPTNPTIGETRVRPLYTELSDEQKQCVADFKDTAIRFIDACEELKATEDGEKSRLAAVAQTKMEEAVMFAVKSVTK
jgi:hypothetical protein